MVRVVCDGWVDEEDGFGSWADVFFFFKQKTAYEMLRSLVGSEMCIRDRAASALKFLNNFESLAVMAVITAFSES